MVKADVHLHSGDILVANSDMSADILRIDPSTNEVAVVFSGGDLEGNITGMELDNSGGLLVSTFDRVIRIDLTSGAQERLVGAPVIGPALPTFWSDIAWTADNRLFATVQKPAALVEVPLPSADLTPINTSEPPNSLEVTSDGIFVSAGSKIIRLDSQTLEQSTVVALATLINDFAITSDAIYLLTDDSVTKFSKSSENLETISQAGAIKNAHGIAVGPNAIFVTDLTEESMVRVDPETGDQVILAKGGVLSRPQRVVILA